MSEKKQPLNGKPALRLGVRRSKSEPRMPSKELEKLLASVYDRFQRLNEPRANAAARRDFVFHMTDWLDDLQRLVPLYEHPERADGKQAGSDIAGFLYHVVPHLKAAGRLLLDEIPDAFGSQTKKG